MPELTRTALDIALATGLEGGTDTTQRAAALDGLAQLGFVWRVEGRPDWEPGIPSLMDYVREFVPIAQASAPREGAGIERK